MDKNIRAEVMEDIVINRQSCRDFSDKELPLEVVKEICNLSVKAPSSCNSQPWKMYIAMGDKLKEIKATMQDNGSNQFLDKAQAIVVISERTAETKPKVKERFGENHFLKYDIGEMVAYLTLIAESKGVKSCIIGWINPENLKKAANLPDGEMCYVAVAMGYSDIDTREKKRKASDEIVKVL